MRVLLGFFLFVSTTLLAVPIVGKGRAAKSGREQDNPRAPVIRQNAPGVIPNPGAPSGAKFMGFFESRPSWTTNSGELHTENTAMLGYQFDPRHSVSYTQYFNTRVFDPHAVRTGVHGESVYLTDAYVAGQANRVWSSDDGRDALHYKAILIPPTDSMRAARGLIFDLRNYLIYNHRYSNTFNLDVMIAPIFHAFSRPGTTVPGINEANPEFEARFIASPNFILSPRLSFSVPVIWQQLKYPYYRNGASYNNRWYSFLWVWPQLTYLVTPTAGVGVAYYTDNLVRDDHSALNLANGLKYAVFQGFMNVAL